MQAEHANEIQPVTRRLVRSLYGNGPYGEGWAEYIAQVMMQQGFADNDPRYRISYLKIWLRSVGNAILEVRMQTMGMTDNEAMSSMMNEAFPNTRRGRGQIAASQAQFYPVAHLLCGHERLVAAAPHL